MCTSLPAYTIPEGGTVATVLSVKIPVRLSPAQIIAVRSLIAVCQNDPGWYEEFFNGHERRAIRGAFSALDKHFDEASEITEHNRVASADSYAKVKRERALGSETLVTATPRVPYAPQQRVKGKRKPMIGS